MKAYVGVTDGGWAAFLAARPELNEVNFWRPSTPQTFRVLTAGEPFYFKSRSPENRVIGGGFYSGFALLPLSEAWELYSEGNGAGSLAQMRTAIGRYRGPIGPDEDPEIGCVLLRDVRFFPPELQVAPPRDFKLSIVQGKGFDLATHAEAPYFQDLLTRLLGQRADFDAAQSWRHSGPVYGDPRLTPQRLGQKAFKAVVLNAYQGRCAITGSRIRPALQAAHILPLPDGGENRLDNGLLLRSDVHTLFDRGYLGVDTNYRLRVSTRLRADFGDGDWLYDLEGEPVAVPLNRADRPRRDFLEWHAETVFKMS
ncbi:HNH endonuclease [Spirillospora sp. CA-253888]